MLAYGEAFDILKNEGASLQLRNYAHKVEDELVARVIKYPMADERKPLTRCTAENTIDGRIADASNLSDELCAESLN